MAKSKSEGILKLSCSAESLYLLIGKADPCETLTVWLRNCIEYTDRGARNFSLCNSAKNAVGVARIRTQLSGKERKHNSNCWRVAVVLKVGRMGFSRSLSAMVQRKAKSFLEKITPGDAETVRLSLNMNVRYNTIKHQGS